MKDKFVGVAKVGEKGQIVIPKEARDMFNIKPGDSMIILCDKEKGIALLKSDFMEESFDKIMNPTKTPSAKKNPSRRFGQKLVKSTRFKIGS